MPELTAATLEDIGGSVPIPTYDRGAVTTGIVHFGVGGFHRAHQAMYLDRLMNEGKALDWGICGIGVMPFDSKMRDVMQAQDCLYTLILKDADGSWEPRVIGSIVQYLYAPDNPEAVIEKMADPSTRIVSMTVTEGGYNFHHVTGKFDETNPAVAADVLPGAVPTTTFGLITEALARRRARGTAPFTIMSCDNIQGNGDVARGVFTAFARLRAAHSKDQNEQGLDEWVASEVHFPNSMVDRITPFTTDQDKTAVSARFNIQDGWPVVCEPFTQWVLEDHFALGRPPFEDVGVQLVTDVEPYELMKLRLLNAGHQALGYFAYLAGHRLVHEAAQDPLFARFLLAYMDLEATPTLEPVPGIDLDAYKHQLVSRFSNGGVCDTVARLCAESSDRVTKWPLDVIRAQLATGGSVTLSIAVVASWARYCEGVDEQGEPIVIVDRLADRLRATASRQHDEPLAFVSDRTLFGDLVDNPKFVESFLKTLDSLHTIGSRGTVENLVRSVGR